MKQIINGLVDRLETEIGKTPTGDLRNLLTDVNIVLQTLNKETQGEEAKDDMEKSINHLVVKLLNKKANENNIIDLNAYALGMGDLKKELDKDGFLTLPDLRNKLSPICHLIAMLEIGEFDLALDSLEQARKSVNYMAQRDVFKDN